MKVKSLVKVCRNIEVVIVNEHGSALASVIVEHTGEIIDYSCGTYTLWSLYENQKVDHFIVSCDGESLYVYVKGQGYWRK